MFGKILVLVAVLLSSTLPLPGASLSLQTIQYIDPLPGSQDNNPRTTIALRYGDPIDPASVAAGAFEVQGTSSGRHSGSLVLSDDHKTLVFRPERPFAFGETVRVSVRPGTLSVTGQTLALHAFSFGIAARPAPDRSYVAALQRAYAISDHPAQPAAAARPTAGPSQFMTVPRDFPGITVTVPANGTAPGDVFVATFGLAPSYSGYLLILDNNGEPAYYRRLGTGAFAFDFQKLPNGNLSYFDLGRLAFIVLDNTYHEIDAITPGNGYQNIDLHELLLLPNGHYLFLADNLRTVDMSKIVSGGNPQTQVLEQIIQEIDQNKNVVFQWRGLDYLPVTDSTESLTAATIDYMHANAMEVDQDGNLLLSSRNLDEVTKINRATGQVMWRLGGKANQFRFAQGPGTTDVAQFYHQHDIRRLANGHITLFDNHDGHTPQVSRAVEYALDETTKTATLVRAYHNSPDAYAFALGNVQTLPDGNIFIGWGANLTPSLVEVKPNGSKAFELDFADPLISYRAFRFPWQGLPTWPATLVLQRAGGSMRLTMSWNGATEIASYRVYGGNTSSPSSFLATVPKSGFESSILLQGADAGFCYYRVMPVNTLGRSTLYSQLAFNTAGGSPSCFKRTYIPMMGVP
jgi:hypothetical protein